MIAKWLDSEEFYELMQTYRWADRDYGTPQDTVDAFEAVKEAIVKKIEEERNRCRYPECVENEDERCPRWLLGECQGPPVT